MYIYVYAYEGMQNKHICFNVYYEQLAFHYFITMQISSTCFSGIQFKVTSPVFKKIF